MQNIFLLRYDTESNDPEAMAGFFEKVVAVHRKEGIPATFFCTGKALESREAAFRAFAAEVRKDPLFDLQDHSYSHIGLGYAAGMSIDDLRADYERSFAAHQRILGNRPTGISICGTSGKDGPRLRGFDETAKGRQELQMVADLGVRMINTHLTDRDEATRFCDYASLGHPDIMGFPSAYSDTAWLHRREYGEPLDFVFARIREHARNGVPMPLMLHDWVAWCRAPDQELTHVKAIAEQARKAGYELRTHAGCYQTASLWISDGR